MPIERPKTWVAGPAIAAAAVALALYAVTIGGTYIFDDVQIITKDVRVQQPQHWKEIFTRDYFYGGVDNLYRPLTTTTFAVQWWLLGDRPWAFHLVNILLHAAVAAATAELARRLAGARVAYIAGLLFAAHPIHVEAVAEIVGRCDELCTLFVLCCLILFLRRPLTTGRAMAIGCCAIAGMLSKEPAMLIPFLLLALGLLTGWHAQSPSEKRALNVLLLILCWSLAMLLVLREEILNLKFDWEKVFLDVATQPLKDSGLTDRILMVFVLIGRYAQLMIAPVKLSIDYGLSVMTSVADRHDPYLYAGVVVLLGWAIALAYALARRRTAAAFCLIALGMTYSMISNILLIGTIFGERLMYLPSAFLLIWLAMQLACLPRGALAGVMLIILSLFALRTVTYARRWNNRQQFYLTSLAEQPKSVRLYILVGDEMVKNGDLAGAAKIAEEGERVAPTYWNIWALAGRVAEQQGNLAAAIADYQHALKLSPVPSLPIKIETLEAQMAHGK